MFTLNIAVFQILFTVVVEVLTTYLVSPRPFNTLPEEGELAG